MVGQLIFYEVLRRTPVNKKKLLNNNTIKRSKR